MSPGIKYYPFLILALLSSCQSDFRAKQVASKARENKDSSHYHAGDVITRAYLDHSGKMWFCTTGEGVYQYDGSRFTQLSESDGLASNEVWWITEDKSGNFWFATSKGLSRYDGKSFHNIPLPPEDVQYVSPETGLPSRYTEGVSCIVKDNSGQFWIGTESQGVYRYDGERFSSHLKFKGKIQPDSVYNNAITNILKDEKGHIWMGSFTHGGLSEYDGQNFIHHPLKDGYGDGMISTSYMDSKGHLWFGTRNTGIYKYNGETFNKIQDQKTGDQIPMASILEDSKARIWIGSFARMGVYLYDGRSFVPFDIEMSDKLIDIKCIAEDKDGNIWFGGRYGLLWMYNGHTLKDFTYLKVPSNPES